MRRLALTSILILLLPLQCFGAISYITSGTVANNTGAAISVSINSSGMTGNNILIVCTNNAANNPINNQTFSGVTWDGVSLTGPVSLGAHAYTAVHGRTSNRDAMQMWYLINPASGTFNLVGTPSTGDIVNIGMIGAFYSGVSQSGFPDASNGVDAGAVSTISTTSAADNTWAVGCGIQDNNSTLAAGTNTTARNHNYSGFDLDLVDTNAAIHPAGTATLNWSGTINPLGLAEVTIAPAVATIASPSTQICVSDICFFQ